MLVITVVIHHLVAFEIVVLEDARKLVHVVQTSSRLATITDKTLEFALLHHQLLQPAFPVRFLEERLLDGPLRRETIYDDRSRLADAVGAVLRLEVLLRIPVGVEEDDRVSGGEVDSLPARAGAKKEELAVFVGVEIFDLDAALVLLDGPIDAAALPAVQQRDPVFEDVEGRFELREDKNFVVVLEEVGEKAGEEEHLAG